MLAIRVLVTRHISHDLQPGVVECVLIDAWGREWRFEDKVAIFTWQDLDANSHYPQPGVIACRIISRRRDADGREVVTVDTASPWYVEATTGESRFDVLPAQIVEL